MIKVVSEWSDKWLEEEREEEYFWLSSEHYEVKQWLKWDIKVQKPKERKKRSIINVGHWNITSSKIYLWRKPDDEKLVKKHIKINWKRIPIKIEKERNEQRTLIRNEKHWDLI